MKILLLTLAVLFLPPVVYAKKSHHTPAKTIANFLQAKKYLQEHLELFQNKTIYCSCDVDGQMVDVKSCGYKIQKDVKRALRLEWEHVVPAESFGQSFVEWREGSTKCFKNGRKFKGRKCAETNVEFNKMESDLYNLFPEDGELNGLRSNYSMAALTSSDKDFGSCHVKIFGKKFEPQDASKGIVARTYLNFDNRYPGHGIVSNKNQKLFEAWDKMYPISALECLRWRALESVAGYKHLFVSKCR